MTPTNSRYITDQKLNMRTSPERAIRLCIRGNSIHTLRPDRRGTDVG